MNLLTLTRLVLLAAFICQAHLASVLPLELDDESWTMVDQELEDPEGLSSGSGSGQIAIDSDFQWIMYSKKDGIYMANQEEIADLKSYISRNIREEYSTVSLVSAGPIHNQMEDGPTKIVADKDKRTRTIPFSARPEVVGQSLNKVKSTNYYPEFAIGILENNCTAFLIGPQQAITTAECVFNYEDKTWKDGLDLWRGRDGDRYLEKMHWEYTILHANYYTTGDNQSNWALIGFPEVSPVWLKMKYSQNIEDIVLTVYGYLPDDHPLETMYSTVCRSDPIQKDPEHMDIQCGSDVKYNGGPVLEGYDFQRSSVPYVYGICVSKDYGYAHQIVSFNPNTFLTLCHLMYREGFDAKCSVVKN